MANFLGCHSKRERFRNGSLDRFNEIAYFLFVGSKIFLSTILLNLFLNCCFLITLLNLFLHLLQYFDAHCQKKRVIFLKRVTSSISKSRLLTFAILRILGTFGHHCSSKTQHANNEKYPCVQFHLLFYSLSLSISCN